MREVGRDAVLARPRDDVEALADALASLAEDPAVYAERSRLVWSGPASSAGTARRPSSRGSEPSSQPAGIGAGAYGALHAVSQRWRPVGAPYSGVMASETIDPAAVEQVNALAGGARRASRQLALLPRTAKDEALHAIADALVAATGEIVTANAEDLERGRENGLAEGLLDRLTLDAARIAAIAQALRDIAALPDPVGEVVRGSSSPTAWRSGRSGSRWAWSA